MASDHPIPPTSDLSPTKGLAAAEGDIEVKVLRREVAGSLTNR